MTDPVLAAGYMARALRLAERGRNTTHPNPSVGCVIVRDGEIVGEGFTQPAGQAHAERQALGQAGERARGAEMFVTLEPCSHFGRTPPCADAVIAAGIRKVWAALEDPNPKVAGQGMARLRAAGIEVEVGLMQAEARRGLRHYLSRMQRGRPWLTLKIGASLDGRTAMASGESRWITGAEARADVHRLRAEAGAVLTSSATVLADDPELTVRLPGDWRQPDRIVLDTQGRVAPAARVWAAGARRYWLSASATPSLEGVTALQIARDAGGHLSLPAAMAALGEQGVNAALVECGPLLAGALLQAGLVDELLAYVSPSLLGHDARPLARLPGLERLSERIVLEWQDVRRVGDDLRLTLRPRVEG
ncbi:MAG TPA: bifunctional diaminohydroxyphosphoribosylaminopyrimidine deaminase/5-amino-6-(5-phosphoribosylamino)uracil reductase RibD [Fontimonas sp.]